MNGKPVYQVPALSVINFDSAFRHKLLCDGLTFTAGSACAYRCSFCYVEDLMRKNPHWQGVLKKDPAAKFDGVVIRREGAVRALVKQLESAKGRALAGQKLVIYASPLVDVAANMELVRETIECCQQILTRTHWDIRLLSKSNLLPKVAEAFAGVPEYNQRLIFGVSTGTLDDGLAKSFEQGTALVSKRIESLHWLQDHGYRTFGMICPSLPQADYARFVSEMAAAIRVDRCEHVWCEVLNARGESFNRTFKALTDGGYHEEARRFEFASRDKVNWETYARETFEAHCQVVPPAKLRFLQYVTKDSRPYWSANEKNGAVLL